MIGEFIKLESDLNLGFGVGVNNIDYKKKATMIPFKACIVAKNNIVCNIEGKQNAKTYDMDMTCYNKYYKISFWEQASNFGTIASIAGMAANMIKEKSFNSMHETMLPKIFNANGEQVGKIEYITVNEGGLQSYYYYKLVVDNIELNCYQIGHDSKEILFVMYDKDNRLVATASKRMKVKNAKARYTIYTKNDEWFLYASMATIIMHQLIYDNSEENITLGSQTYSLHTHQKGLLDKYDPDFIPNIISQEDPANLPENMPLVEEKIKQSQSTGILKYRRISTFIFAMAFIILILFLIIKGK